MLLPYTTLTYYGPGAAASSDAGSVGSFVGEIQGFARALADLAGAGGIIDADATRLVNSPATIAGAGVISGALPKARARPTATIKVNSLSQDDVTGAVLEAEIEPGFSLKQVLRIMAASMAGKASGGGTSTVAFRNIADTKARITASVDENGNRTAVTLDAD